MHPDSEREMARMLDCWAGPANVLDVGSLDVNGTFRAMCEGRGWTYTGLDIVDGPNVDVVSLNEDAYPFPAGAFDIVISGSTMEHVRMPWLWVPELARLLRPDGMLAICTVWCWQPHTHPVDCYRFLPDGMKVLFDLAGSLERYDIRRLEPYDLAAQAWRRG